MLEVGFSPWMLPLMRSLSIVEGFGYNRFYRLSTDGAMGGFSLILNATSADALPVTSPDECRVRTNP